MLNGNWSEAIQKYKELDITATQLSEYAEKLTKSELCDLALLGFYCREEEYNEKLVKCELWLKGDKDITIPIIPDGGHQLIDYKNSLLKRGYLFDRHVNRKKDKTWEEL